MPIRLILVICVLGSGISGLSAADQFSLHEDANSGASFQVATVITGEGTFEFQPPKDDAKPVTHPVLLEATFRFLDRRLPPAGREEAAYRSLRRFEKADSRITVGGQTSVPALRDERSDIVARATRSGIVSYSLDGPLTATEAELLPFTGDPLALAALLPDREVSVGETWTPAGWVGPAIAGVEVALNQKSSCRLESVRNELATVHFDSQIDGATKGATTTIALKGDLTFSLAAKAIVGATVSHTESRSIGPLSPGMKLTLKAEIERTPLSAGNGLADELAKSIPLEPEATDLWIEHVAPFGVVLAGNRGWRVFHQTDSLLILRLLDSGGLIAQCNVAPAPKVPAGQQTPGRLLEDAVKNSLGEQFTEIVSTEKLETGGDLAVYRVEVSGKAKDSKRLWRYYLITAPDGRQAELVFTLEPDHVNRLVDRDLDLVTSLQFLSQKDPTPAETKP